MEVSTLDKICPLMTYINAIKRDQNIYMCTKECARFSIEYNTCINMVDKIVRIKYYNSKRLIDEKKKAIES